MWEGIGAGLASRSGGKDIILKGMKWDKAGWTESLEKKSSLGRGLRIQKSAKWSFWVVATLFSIKYIGNWRQIIAC